MSDAVENELKPPALQTTQLVVGGSIIAIFILVAIFGPLLYDFNPASTDVLSRLLPPFSQTQSGRIAYLGTDELGRDILGQIIYGSRVSLTIAIGTVLGGGVFGTAIGIMSGYFRGTLDTIVMRLADMQLSIPPVVLAIVVVGVLGAGVTQLIIALAFTRWVMFARVARSATLVARQNTYVDAAIVAGLNSRQIMIYHVLPSAMVPVMVVATLQLGLVILAEASLSFLGLGTTPLQPTWGLVIANGRGLIDIAWWISVMPGIALATVVVSFAVVGDALQRRL